MRIWWVRPVSRRQATSVEALDVGHRLASVRRPALGFRDDLPARAPRRATEPVASIAHEDATKDARADVPVRDGEVTPVNRVFAKLRRKALLGEPRPREDDEPRRLLVQPVDDAEGRPAPPRREPLPSHPAADAQVEGVDLAVVVGDGAHTRGLRHHDDLRVGEDDLVPRQLARARPPGPFVQVDRHPGPHASRRLQNYGAAYPHFPGPDPRARLAPARAKEGADGPIKGALELRRNDLARRGRHVGTRAAAATI
jgi:hypothetical protein